MIDIDCHICGTCWWVDCKNDADYTVDVTLNRNGFPIYDGKVELCGGHTREQNFRRTNGIVPHLSLNWKAVEQAVTLQESRR